MKKYWYVVVCACLIGSAVMVNAADPVYGGFFHQNADMTLSAKQWTASTWTVLDSCIYTITDTGRVFATFEGYVTLDPGESFYISCNDDSLANKTTPKKDTCILFAPKNQRGPVAYYFRYTYVDSVVSQTDLVDTVWFNGATGSASSVVAIKNLLVTGRIGDKNPY